MQLFDIVSKYTPCRSLLLLYLVTRSCSFSVTAFRNETNKHAFKYFIRRLPRLHKRAFSSRGHIHESGVNGLKYGVGHVGCRCQQNGNQLKVVRSQYFVGK